MTTRYYGETLCDNDECENWAYFEQDDECLCGKHSQKTERDKMDENPQKKKLIKEYYESMKKKVELLSKKNKGKGKIIVKKMKMFEKTLYTEGMRTAKCDPYKSGYLKVYPNFKHASKKDGFGCNTLSPMYLGPVHHGQPNLPVAKNIENFHVSFNYD